MERKSKLSSCKSEDFDYEFLGHTNIRSGKWTKEEENYANKVIRKFLSGKLRDCEDGTTLRAYLSRKLNCAPMRISKKFAGKGIGKFIYSSTKYLQLAVASTSSTTMMAPASPSSYPLQQFHHHVHYVSDNESTAQAHEHLNPMVIDENYKGFDVYMNGFPEILTSSTPPSTVPSGTTNSNSHNTNPSSPDSVNTGISVQLRQRTNNPVITASQNTEALPAMKHLSSASSPSASYNGSRYPLLPCFPTMQAHFPPDQQAQPQQQRFNMHPSLTSPHSNASFGTGMAAAPGEGGYFSYSLPSPMFQHRQQLHQQHPLSAASTASVAAEFRGIQRTTPPATYATSSSPRNRNFNQIFNKHQSNLNNNTSSSTTPGPNPPINHSNNHSPTATTAAHCMNAHSGGTAMTNTVATTHNNPCNDNSNTINIPLFKTTNNNNNNTNDSNSNKNTNQHYDLFYPAELQCCNYTNSYMNPNSNHNQDTNTNCNYSNDHINTANRDSNENNNINNNNLNNNSNIIMSVSDSFDPSSLFNHENADNDQYYTEDGGIIISQTSSNDYDDDEENDTIIKDFLNDYHLEFVEDDEAATVLFMTSCTEGLNPATSTTEVTAPTTQQQITKSSSQLHLI